MSKKDKIVDHCFYCGRPLSAKTVTTDHKHPRCLGGSNDKTNRVKCCKPCNLLKGCMLYDEFRVIIAYQKGLVKLPKMKFFGEKEKS